MTRVYYDKIAEARMTVFIKMYRNVLTLCLPSLTTKFDGGLLDWGGSNWGGVVSDFAILYLGMGA